MPNIETQSTDELSYYGVLETTFGTPPSTPTLLPLRVLSEGLSDQREFARSQELRGDRMIDSIPTMSRTAGGDMSTEFSYGNHDSLIQCALFNSWVTESLPAESAATDIAIVKVAGTSSTWELTASSSSFADFITNSIIRVNGFTTAGSFYARVLSVASATSMFISPERDIASESAGDSVSVLTMEYIQNGTTRKSMYLQRYAPVLSQADRYYHFYGQRVNTWNIEISPGSIITSNFSFMGSSGTMSTSQLDSATVGTRVANDLMNSTDSVISVVYDSDISNPEYFTSFSLTIDNQLRNQSAIGSMTPIGIEPGQCMVTGSAEFYMRNQYSHADWNTGRYISFMVPVQDSAGNAYIFSIPRAKLTRFETVGSGTGADVFVSIDFETASSLDASGKHVIRIARRAAA